ncbi:MAG TPA: hypothetical protein VK449_03235 [Anaerolineales bacterium]|nr:hypothetical protein [Anaerolineales bacterium]
MAGIRILSRPAGEAPPHIRDAWVGLTLPLPNDSSGRRRSFRASGVLTGPTTFLGTLSNLLLGRTQRYFGYGVATLDALRVLEAHDPDAAAWWRAHTPHLLKPQGRFIFEAEVCEEVP